MLSNKANNNKNIKIMKKIDTSRLNAGRLSVAKAPHFLFRPALTKSLGCF